MSLPDGLQAAVAARYERFIDDLASLVNVDCGSYTPEGVNQVADAVSESLAELGATVERILHRLDGTERQLGDLVVGRFEGTGPRLLLIGHMDTVFEPGTAAQRPFHIEGERATGPGVSDMKGGLLAGPSCR